VNDDLVDDGLTSKELRGTAWILGLVAIGSLVRLLAYAADGARAHAGLIVWALIGTMAAVFSGCCAVLAGLKSVEQRLARHAEQSSR
jgi:hypothetical protein